MRPANDVPMKPLIYCARSILDWQRHRKTQTRRLIAPQPLEGLSIVQTEEGLWIAQDETRFELLRQPYAVGDLLWIREGLQRSYHEGSENAIVAYQADWKVASPDGLLREWNWKRYKLPGMFMPRWACRYYARVLSVRPERLQDISVEDAVAEGMPPYTRARGVLSAIPPDQRWWYIELWDSLHKKPGHRWAENPWVWVYGLEEIDGSSD